MTDLDTLLSMPLEPVTDAGFSSRVMRDVLRQQSAMHQHRAIIEWTALLVAAAIFLTLVPFASLTHAIEAVTLNASSFPVAVALAALVLTVTFAHHVVDRAE